MQESDRLREKRRMQRLNSLASLILGDATEKSAQSTKEIIGLGAREARESADQIRKSIGDVRRASKAGDESGVVDSLLSSDDPMKAERDMATWLAAIRGGLDPIDTPEMDKSPDLDFFLGQDIDAAEDVTDAQADRIVASSETGYDNPADIPAGDLDYSDLPGYMQITSEFRTALNEVEAPNYDYMFNGAHLKDTPFKGTKVTDMTMGEIFDLMELGGDWHNYNLNTHDQDTTAIGKYQMVGLTLRDLRDRNILKKMGITDDTKFDKATQDSIAMHLAERRVKPTYSIDKAVAELKNEWEGFKKLPKSRLVRIVNEIRGST